ncbi:MAG: biopolymer transporter ExbD [Pirellulaceae bacterium]|nr:biopolymer transporter ExbD [Pirellulaceae bacterium]
MRFPSPFRDQRKSLELNLTPMIDCVFLLMVYFIWSSSFAIVERSLPSQLTAASGSGVASPTEPPPPEADFDDVVVRILWTGRGPAWQVNETPIATLAELRGTLATIARIKRDAPVILDPDRQVPLGDVIDVFDLSRLVGFEKVQFATTVPVN